MKNLFSDLNEVIEEKEIPDLKGKLIDEFGERGKKALDGVMDNRVKRYRDFWVVVGENEHVVVNERFCDCEDYLYNISSKDPGAMYCWHSLSVILAKALNKFDEIDDWYLSYRN